MAQEIRSNHGPSSTTEIYLYIAATPEKCGKALCAESNRIISRALTSGGLKPGGLPPGGADPMASP